MEEFCMSYRYEKRGMSTGTIIAIIIVAVMFLSIFSVVGSCIGTYNNLVNKEEDVNLAWANVQNMMQSRLEKIPDLVEVAKYAAEHEEKIFEDIANARAALSSSIDAGDAQAVDEADKELSKAINAMMLVINENYPTISASEQFVTLMDQIEGAANRIAVARENYNTAVSNYNRVVRNFPGAILANMFGFDVKETFEADEAASNSSMVDFGK